MSGLLNRWRYWRKYGSRREQLRRAGRVDARRVDEWLDSLRAER